MKFYSTNSPDQSVSFREAVLKGLPQDNGLYMPLEVPVFDSRFWEQLSSISLQVLAFKVLKPYCHQDIDDESLKEIVVQTFSFDIPLIQVHDNIYSLELFHGPTMAFKDVGAGFLARCIGHFAKGGNTRTVVLVATSGDTGGAVANGFCEVENTEVVILYPKGKVSNIQESQFTTLGKNIHALRIDGTFDDCQKLVKAAFLDHSLCQKINLTSANSINIARLIPQSVYYYWAIAQLGAINPKLFISVPSGNLGNLTAGLIAKHSGLPVLKFISATNSNDTFPKFLHTGDFTSKKSVTTISNAMDVGNPSNFLRIKDLYRNDKHSIHKDLMGFAFSDDQTRSCLKEIYEHYNYLQDPHGAVGYLGLQSAGMTTNSTGIFLETAHPAKFLESVEPTIGQKVDIPHQLSQAIDKPKKYEDLDNTLNALKAWLMDCLI